MLLNRTNFSDWIAVDRTKHVQYDLENKPLLIKTNSALGSGKRVVVVFYNSVGYGAGGVNFNFLSPPKYHLRDCDGTPENLFPTELPSDVNKVWRVTLIKTSVSGDADRLTVRLLVHCNDKLVLDFMVSETTCIETRPHWWERDVTQIWFADSDSASTYYSTFTGLSLGTTLNVTEARFYL